jgi:hypothetical protein
MPVRVVWNGDKLLERVARAAAEAIDETTAATQADAETTHWWTPRHARGLESQLRTEAAVADGSRIIGRVGVTYSGQKGVRSGFYGLFLETKTPWLRPAGDRNFPTLAARIARRLNA